MVAKTPKIETKSRNIPHATTPPMMGNDEILFEVLQCVARAIKHAPTTYVTSNYKLDSEFPNE